MIKKIFFAFSILVIGFFASCKKDYTCACFTTITNNSTFPALSINSNSTSIIHDTKGNATTKCIGQNTTFAIFDLSTKVECKI